MLNSFIILLMSTIFFLFLRYTTSLNFEVLAMLQLKPWSVRGASYHPAFVGNWPTIIYTFLALSTHWMSSS